MWVVPTRDAGAQVADASLSLARSVGLGRQPRPRQWTLFPVRACHWRQGKSRLRFSPRTASPRRSYSTRLGHTVLYFGTDEFAVTPLKALLKERDVGGVVKYLEVITPPDAPACTANVARLVSPVAPVKVFALENNLTVRHPPPRSLRGWTVPAPVDSAFAAFDVAVAVSCGYFLPKTVLSAFKAGTLNVHPSLLPKYRGGAPIHHTLMNCDGKTGVSIIDLHPEKFDAGRILKQVEVPIKGKPFLAQLSKTLAEIGAEMLLDTLRNLSALQANAINQDEEGVIKAAVVDRTHAQVDFAKLTAEQLYARHRAVSHQFPLTAYLPRRKEPRVRLMEIDDPESVLSLQPIPAGAAPGTFVYDPVRDALFIRCCDGASLPVRRLHVVGRRNAVCAEEWFRGYGDRWNIFVSPHTATQSDIEREK